jgi:hypothetical protein
VTIRNSGTVNTDVSAEVKAGQDPLHGRTGQ